MIPTLTARLRRTPVLIRWLAPCSAILPAQLWSLSRAVLRALFPALLAALFVTSARAAEPLPALLLVASERIDDPRFRQSVVLVIRHGGPRSGAIGVIINRPLRLSLRQLFPGIPEPTQFSSLHYGGPVSPENIVFLFRTKQTVPPDVLQVHPKVYLAQSPSLLGRLLHRDLPSERLQVFAGYAGWSPGQLENEIQRGDWLLLPVDDEMLFPSSPQQLWKELHRRASLRTTGLSEARPASAADPL